MERKTIFDLINSNRELKSKKQADEEEIHDSSSSNPSKETQNIYERDGGKNDPDQYNVPHSLSRRWLATRHGTRWCDRTMSTYQSTARFYINFLDESGTSLLYASFVDFVSFIEYRVRQGLSKSTINKDRAAIRDMYEFIEIRTDAQPEIDLQKFKEFSIDQYNYPSGFQRENISLQEVDLLFDNLDNARNLLMTYFAVVTGVRNSDIRSLKFSDIDESEEEILISNPKYGNSYLVPMSKELNRRLIQWKVSGRKSYSPRSENDYVFPSKYGGKLENNWSYNKYVREAAESAGIQEVIGQVPITGNQCNTSKEYRNMYRVTAHTLRHTFVTLLKENGAPPETRRLAANHKDRETTEQYEHDNDEWHDLVRTILNKNISS